ncbi:MAG: hypothetical protein R3F59_36270 [Myxococcota bacterium]
MRKSISRIAMALAAALIIPTAAQAAPLVKVRVGPAIVAPAPVVVAPAPVVLVRPARPGPNYVWVDPHWRADRFGRRTFVAGHWAPRPAVVVAPAPRRVVVVHHY